MNATEDRKSQLVEFVRAEAYPEFQPDDELLPVLDSMGVIKLLMFVESGFGVILDIAALGMDAFRDIDTLLAAIDAG
jgi:acyl carrier protein